jgi:hypothetical protein
MCVPVTAGCSAWRCRTQGQLAKGMQVLNRLSSAVQSGRPQHAVLEELSSQFYTVIPHASSRSTKCARRCCRRRHRRRRRRHRL